MASPKTSGSTITRFEHPNTDEAEENGLKNNIRKMIEAIKEKMKHSLKEVKENTNKRLGYQPIP